MQLRPARAAGDDEAGLLENPQVLHHAEAGHLELGLELGERTAVALEEPVEQMAAGRIGECPEDLVVVHARIIGDQMVTCQAEGDRSPCRIQHAWPTCRTSSIPTAISSSAGSASTAVVAS